MGKRLFEIIVVLSVTLALAACSVPAPRSQGAETGDGTSSASSISSTQDDAQSKTATSGKKTVRILCIGNSWTGRCIRHFGAIAQSAGVNSVVGYAFLSKGTLQEQYFALLNGGGTFTYNGKRQKVRSKIVYRKFTGAKGRKFEYGSTLKHALKDQSWDYIILQNRAPESGDYSVWDKSAKGNSDALIKDGKKVKFDVNDFVDLIKKTMKPKAAKKVKIGLSAVWSYAAGQTGGVAGGISRYLAHKNGGVRPTTQKQWNALYKKLHRDIQKTIPRVKKHMGKRCDFIVNPGLVLYRAGKVSSLAKYGYKLRASQTNAHPAEGLPCYLVTLSYAYRTIGLRKGQALWYPTQKTTSYRVGASGKLVKYSLKTTPKVAKRALAIVSEVER